MLTKEILVSSENNSQFLLSALCSCYSFCFSLWLPKSNWDLILWLNNFPASESAFMFSCSLHLLQALCINITSQILICCRLAQLFEFQWQFLQQFTTADAVVTNSKHKWHVSNIIPEFNGFFKSEC